MLGSFFVGTMFAFIKAISLWRARNAAGIAVVSPSKGMKEQTLLTNRQLGLLGIRSKVAVTEPLKKPPKTKFNSASTADVLVPLHQPVASSNRSSQLSGGKSNTSSGSKTHSFSTPSKPSDIIAVVQSGKIVETGSHDDLISKPNGAYASLVQLQEAASSHCLPSCGPTMGQPLSIKYSHELSHTSSHGASFQSDKVSVSRIGGEVAEIVKPTRVSSRRLYSMVGPDWIYGVSGTICAFIAGAQFPLFALGVTQALVSYYMDWDTTCREVKKIALLFCGGAVITVIVNAITHLSFGIMGERLTLRVREMMFSAILRNEIGWFDQTNNTSSMLASRLESDATLLRTVVVDRSTILLHNVGLVVTSFVIAFTLNWRLTLVVMATYPLIISGHISEKMFMKGYGGNLSKAYLKANMLAGEAVSNIRTVAAFCSEEKVLDLYMIMSLLNLQGVHLLVVRLLAYSMESLNSSSSHPMALLYGMVLF